MLNIFKLSKSLLLALPAALLFAPQAASAACPARDDAVTKTCKPVTAKAMPADLKKFIAKSGCNVKPGSPYDEGYAVDLNGDGNPEYAYCCTSAKHGPCGLKIFGKIGDKWAVLSEEMYFPTDPDAPCGDIAPLKSKSAGYSDVCIDGGSTLLKFKDGKYREGK